ncbi:uncharacterized protein LOC143283223 [Babylonia areolata]|uniref:uncharacterized protein LOC143283223 n=1 Tax=Babylonia areolata TaxID=304850 RepID=UPI003FD68A76
MPIRGSVKVTSLKNKLLEEEARAKEGKNNSSKLREELGRIETAKTALQSKIRALEEERKELKTKITQLESQLDRQSLETDHIKSQCGDLAVEKSTVDERVRGLETERAQQQVLQKQQQKNKNNRTLNETLHSQVTEGGNYKLKKTANWKQRRNDNSKFQTQCG